MKEALKHWRLILIKGIILVILSIIIFRHPVGTLLGLTLYIGIALMLTGLMLIVSALTNRKADDHWGLKLTEGIFDVLFAFILLSNPAITAAVFPFLVGFWMIFYGIMLFTGSFAAKKGGDGSWWINLIGGLLTVIFGYFIMTNLLAGVIVISFLMGAGFMIFGLVNIFMAFSMKKLNAVGNG